MKLLQYTRRRKGADLTINHIQSIDKLSNFYIFLSTIELFDSLRRGYANIE